MPTERRRSALRAGLFAITAAASGIAAATDAGPGRELFTGQRPLAARLAGHAQDLPASAVRCVNCHAMQEVRGTAATGFAPALTASHLRMPRARRGGPPSRYDTDTFCRLLRDGVDPAGVLIDTAMPRYRMSAHDCAALWNSLAAP